MIFSQRVREDAQAGFARMLPRCGSERGREILAELKAVRRDQGEDAAAALEWLYANSPLSDWANYAPALFRSCAEHGVFLHLESPLARDIPEDIFLNYVLHIRVNTEALCDCRRFFHSQLSERLQGLSPAEAVLEVNYWNAEHVAYQSTDQRTISALGAYHSTFGRCGEESVFAVNVFRAMGIPARQVYTPFWAHCDDNHAWVEVWCGGQWHFLGACEPEEVLDHGWFTNAASRAMLIHSRCFGTISGEEVISRAGMTTFLNHLPRYASAKCLTVAVRDSEGHPVEGAQVTFGILNYSSLAPVAEVVTDCLGEATLTCGLGSLDILVRKDGVSAEEMVFTPDTDRVELVLGTPAPPLGVWENFISIAPRDRAPCGTAPTPAQRALGQKKAAAAGERRTRREAALFDERRCAAVVEQYGYSPAVYELLRSSLGNGENLLIFLEDASWTPREKEALLLTLSQKDLRDVDIEVLGEALDTCQDYTGPRELFYPYVVCPRVWNEPLASCRRFIQSFFSPEEAARFRADPRKIWTYIQTNIGWDPSVEYTALITLPTGALTTKNASPASQRVLFVAICRSLGIPARVNPVDHRAEYYNGESFLPVECGTPNDCTVIFTKESQETWQHGADFGLASLMDGAWQSLDLSGQEWVGDRMTVFLPAGAYRVITDNRLPCGDIYASWYHFSLVEGAVHTVMLRRHSANLSQLLVGYDLEEFVVSDLSGTPVSGSDLTGAGPAVLLWLEAGREPTEHILNEMLDRAAAFEALSSEIVFLVEHPEALDNPKLRQVLNHLPRTRVCVDRGRSAAGPLVRRLYTDPEKLPLIVVTSGPLRAVYVSSGYNVGSADMLLRICESPHIMATI